MIIFIFLKFALIIVNFTILDKNFKNTTQI